MWVGHGQSGHNVLCIYSERVSGWLHAYAINGAGDPLIRTLSYLE